MTFYELEKKCKKRRILFIVLIIFIITILILSSIYLYLKFFKTQNTKTIQVKKIKTKIPNKESVKEIKIKKPLKRIILPDIDLNDVNITDKIKKAKKIKEVKESKKELKEPKNLLIKSQNLPSFQTCINLAKKYFEQKNYTQALKWSKNANIQNPKDPASWIITAKSLNALGKKEKALKILKIYNNFYHNKDVKRVIKEIEK